jgi:hypothetical protein
MVVRFASVRTHDEPQRCSSATVGESLQIAGNAGSETLTDRRTMRSACKRAGNAHRRPRAALRAKDRIAVSPIELYESPREIYDGRGVLSEVEPITRL